MAVKLGFGGQHNKALGSWAGGCSKIQPKAVHGTTSMYMSENKYRHTQSLYHCWDVLLIGDLQRKRMEGQESQEA